MSGRYVRMKEWRIKAAAKLGVSTATVVNWIYDGKIALPAVIQKNKRVIFVRDEYLTAIQKPPPELSGRWVQMKEWRETMAERLGLRPSTIAMQITRGALKPKTIHRSKRDVLVLLEDES